MERSGEPEPMGENCIFCRIARGEAPAYKVYEDEEILVILDIMPVEKGHLLVMPRSHHESIHDTPPRLAARVWLAASALARIYRVELEAPGVNIVSNSGRPAGQEVFHFHVHVIPRWSPARRGFRGRHRLTREEAEEVITMLEPHTGIIREYLGECQPPQTKG